MVLTTVQVQAADGNTYNVIGDVVGDQFYPLYKLASGAIDAAGDVISDAAPLPVKLTDGNYTFKMDPLGYVTMIDILHYRIHEEGVYSACHIFNAVAAGATALLRLQVPAGVKYHWTVSISVILKAEVELLRGTTYSGAGTPVIARNRDDTSLVTTGGTVFHTPTINVAGTVIEEALIPAGVKVNSSGGAVGEGRNEWILRPSTDYLVRVTNTGAQPSDISVEMEWYEEPV